MALKFWLGPSGSGKSTKLYNYMIEESIRNPDISYFVIVPEQANLLTQQELVRLHPRGGILNMDVLSFNRLAHRIFEETGYGRDGGRVIDDMGKNLILRRVSQLHEGELPLLGDNLAKLGYITQVKSVISEFMQYGINLDKAESLALKAEEASKGQLAQKLKDITALYGDFLKYIKDNYTTREELMIRLADTLKESAKIKKTVVAFDGFTGFTPVQLEVIRELLVLCPEVHVVLELDKRDKSDDITIEEHELFYLCKHTIHQIGALADFCNIPQLDDEIINDEIPVRFGPENKELVHLERNLFRESSKVYKGDNSDNSNNSDKTNISISKALNPDEEMERVAASISNLIRNEDYRYRDIAIITGDIETYRSSIERALFRHNIPYFTDKTQPVLLNPMTEYLRAAVSVLADNYTYESVFRLLKTGLTTIKREDIDELENYCLATGVKGRSRYLKPFSALPSAYRRLDSDTKANYLLKINSLRGDVSSLFADLERDISDKFNAGTKASVRCFCLAFYNMLSRENVANQLKVRSKELLNEGRSYEAKVYEQIYKRTLMVFEQMVELLGDEMLTIREFGQLLDAGLDEIRIGVIPSTGDYVQVGDLTRSRVGDVKALYLVGVNDGLVPQGVSGGGLLSDDDKNFFLDSDEDVTFSPTARENAYTQRLYLYMMLTKPREFLNISYAKINQSGESIRPSYLIRTLKAMFEGVERNSASEDLLSMVSDKKGSFSLISANLEKYVDGKSLGEDALEDEVESFNKTFKELVSFYGQDEEYNRKLTSLIKNLRRESLGTISRAVATAMYGHKLNTSITRLEKFANCAYEYYLEYGLKLKNREMFDFAAKDLGSVFHSALEMYTNRLRERGISWDDVSDEVMDEVMDEAVDFAVASEDMAALYSSRRTAYMVKRIKRIMKRTAAVLKYQSQKGMFVPGSVEVDFDSISDLDALNLKISDEDSIRLYGRIDRIDTYTENDTTYVKVIDYKSGNVSLDINAVYEGRQLQLVVYMDTALEMTRQSTNTKAIPAGILYYHIDDPLIKEGDIEDIAEIEDQIRKKLRLSGYVNSDRHIIDLMDDDFDKKSDVIPVSLKKDKSLGADSRILSTEEFEALSKGAREVMISMGEKILNGEIISAKETKEALKHRDTCKFCEFKSVCKHRTNRMVEEDKDEE